MKKVRRVWGATPRVKARVLAFLQKRPAGCGLQGAARRVFFAMKKVMQVWGATPRVHARPRAVKAKKDYLYLKKLCFLV